MKDAPVVTTPLSAPESTVHTHPQRVLLKLSGEALKGSYDLGFDFPTVDRVAEEISHLLNPDLQIALVIGAGNLFRGKAAAEAGMDRVSGDQVGMLGTLMNALVLANAFRRAGTPYLVQSAVSVPGAADPFDRDAAVTALENGCVVLFAGGTGHPFFTTDTTAALRAAEIGAHALLKATKVDGIYARDPKRHPDSPRFRKLAYADALSQRLEVMDGAAFSLCMENGIPIIVFNYSRPDALAHAVAGHAAHATYVGAVDTEIAAPD